MDHNPSWGCAWKCRRPGPSGRGTFHGGCFHASAVYPPQQYLSRRLTHRPIGKHATKWQSTDEVTHIIMSQEWDSALTPGMPLAQLFFTIFILTVQRADSHVAAERQHGGPATHHPQLRGYRLTIRNSSAPGPTQEVLLTTFSYRFHHRPPRRRRSESEVEKGMGSIVIAP